MGLFFLFVFFQNRLKAIFKIIFTFVEKNNEIFKKNLLFVVDNQQKIVYNVLKVKKRSGKNDNNGIQILQQHRRAH